MLSCILFHFYIKPQHIVRITLNYSSCILFHFYIKPQHWFDRKYPFVVVSYSISTSNHNCVAPYLLAFFVVSYSISTSNHNSMRAMNWMCQLYLIPFLHQTTTNGSYRINKVCCILFHFYIKPQPPNVMAFLGSSCILFHFYIKPQRLLRRKFLTLSCILFHFYIKPQQIRH